MGDTIVALPCFHKISEIFPDHKKIVLTNFPVSSKAVPLESLLGPTGLVDGVIEYPVNLRSFKKLWALKKELRGVGTDTLIYLNSSRGRFSTLRDIIFFKLCGFSKIIGAPTSNDLLSCRQDVDSGIFEFESKRLTRTIGCLGQINLDNKDYWNLHLKFSELSDAFKKFPQLTKAPYFSINMGGKHDSKYWGDNNWYCLILAIKKKYPSMQLVIIGSDADFIGGEKVLHAMGERGLNLCGLLAPRESACILSRASFFVGHDSGPLHLAASQGVPCIGLFGNYNKPNKWHPYGKNNYIIHNQDGVGQISVNEVLNLVDIISKKLYTNL